MKAKGKRQKVKRNERQDEGARPVCEACGEPFSCGALDAGCWCAEVKLTEEARASLRERYAGCLCRGCLERAAGGRN